MRFFPVPLNSFPYSLPHIPQLILLHRGQIKSWIFPVVLGIFSHQHPNIYDYRASSPNHHALSTVFHFPPHILPIKVASRGTFAIGFLPQKTSFARLFYRWLFPPVLPTHAYAFHTPSHILSSIRLCPERNRFHSHHNSFRDFLSKRQGFGRILSQFEEC